MSRQLIWQLGCCPDQVASHRSQSNAFTYAWIPDGCFCEPQVAVIVAVMASRFKLALASGGRKAALERQTLDSILHLKGGMKMVFVPRASIGFSSRL